MLGDVPNKTKSLPPPWKGFIMNALPSSPENPRPQFKANASLLARFARLGVASLILTLGLLTGSAMAERPSLTAVTQEVAADEGVPEHRVIVTAITLERTEVVGNTIIEHYRYDYLILPEDETTAYQPSTLDESRAYVDQREHVLNLRSYYRSKGRLPESTQTLQDINETSANIVDPWLNPYEYQFVSNEEARIISHGEDGVKGTPDDLIMSVSIDPSVDGPVTDADIALGFLALMVCMGSAFLLFAGIITCGFIVYFYRRRTTTQFLNAELAT